MQSLLEQHGSDIGKPPPFQKMMMAAPENDRSNIVRYCMKKGASISGFVIRKAAISNTCNTQRVLVTVGGIDVNHDVGGFGDFACSRCSA